MNIILTVFKKIFARQPLSALGKVAAGIILAIAIVLGILGLAVAQMGLVINALVLLLIAAVVATGIRWTPLLVSLVCGGALYVFVFQSSFPLYHLAHPKDAYDPWWLAYIIFIMISILFWCMLMGLGAGIAATIQNYTQRERHTPRWFTPALNIMIGILLGAILLGAFGPTLPAASATTATTGGEPTVHLGISNFSVSSITIAKGSKLLLVDDGTFEHNIGNGMWVNGQPQQENVTGEPTVNHVDINGAGKTLEIGPFATAGTYHLYCSIHQGMVLTVVVQ
ncbi:MAG TPA: plastocyanin/azurin family copper-binding protein [Ktedonosporobacter sp.]|nr:plastocyanin/azurin family copper-binding protein [Ktedonosporobacter sp.]